MKWGIKKNPQTFHLMSWSLIVSMCPLTKGQMLQSIYMGFNEGFFFFSPVRDGVFGQCETPKDPRYPDCASKMDVSPHIWLNSGFHSQNKRRLVFSWWLTLAQHKCCVRKRDVWRILLGKTEVFFWVTTEPDRRINTWYIRRFGGITANSNCSLFGASVNITSCVPGVTSSF